jgi:probable FeS assembly SUF system protein SufT
MTMHENTEKELSRDVEAIQIPSGFKTTLTAGTRVVITQALGGSYTVATDRGLARIDAGDADALGIDAAAQPAPADVSEAAPADPAAMEKAVWDQLKTCYDPEIPVNIVDLGLIYDCRVEPQEAGAKVAVKMTLTAPGCGMGPAIAAEAKNKVMTVTGISDADVELVWDPPWNPSMISEAGKMKLGML